MQPLVDTTKWGACPQCLQNGFALAVVFMYWLCIGSDFNYRLRIGSMFISDCVLLAVSSITDFALTSYSFTGCVLAASSIAGYALAASPCCKIIYNSESKSSLKTVDSNSKTEICFQIPFGIMGPGFDTAGHYPDPRSLENCVPDFLFIYSGGFWNLKMFRVNSGDEMPRGLTVRLTATAVAAMH